MAAVDELKPRPRPSARFWDRTAKRYAKRPIADEAAYQRKLDVTRGYLRPDMELLEIGCGTGSTAIAHAPFVKHILATDISSRMIEIARAKISVSTDRNVSFVRAAVEDLDAPDGRFDAALALNILHLLEDWDAAIAKVARLLKPGGVFATNTACLADSMRWFRLIAPIGRALGVFPLVKVFSEADLKDSLTRHGFRIDHYWRPEKGPTVFMVAIKTG
jgi:ubiquinone/menaquinone biosynthesis C-methylase UbiE